MLTLKGWKDAYLLVYVNVATRRAIATVSTEHPDAKWVAQQASSFKSITGESGCRVLTRDSDTKFGKAFDGALRDTGVTPVRLPHCSPNLNAHAERFIQTLQTECLDRFIVMDTGTLDHLEHLTCKTSSITTSSSHTRAWDTNRPPPKRSRQRRLPLHSSRL